MLISFLFISIVVPSRAVLVIDMLHEFVRGRLRSPQAERIVPNVRRIVEKAREVKVPVIHVVDAHLPTDIEVRVIWGHHAMKGSPEARIIEELEPRTDLEFVLEKRWYSGFRDTGLDVLLRDLNVSELIVTGIATNVCVLHTVADAVYHRYRVYVVRDATAAIGIVDSADNEHEYALTYMSVVYRASVIDTEEAVRLLGSS